MNKSCSHIWLLVVVGLVLGLAGGVLPAMLGEIGAPVPGKDFRFALIGGHVYVSLIVGYIGVSCIIASVICFAGFIAGNSWIVVVRQREEQGKVSLYLVFVAIGVTLIALGMVCSVAYSMWNEMGT